MEIAVFGDTGGHFRALKPALEELGVDLENYKIPSHLKIIHIGDLIHKGPSTEVLVYVIDKLIRNNPGQWIQLVGNHELQHLPFTGNFWRCDCSEEVEETINFWWEEGLMVSAYALDNIATPHLTISDRTTFDPVSQSWLFTHAGLTQTTWEVLGSPVDAIATANMLNGFSTTQLDQAGLIMGYHNNPNVSHVWAIGSSEVFPTWWGDIDMPFSQVHGHTSQFIWDLEKWRGDHSKEIKAYRANTKLNPSNRTSITLMSEETVMVGIDPGFEIEQPNIVQPYLILTEDS